MQPFQGHPLVLDFITPDDHSHEEREPDPRLFARQVEKESSTGTVVVITPNTGVLTFEGAAPNVNQNGLVGGPSPVVSGVNSRF